MASITKDSKDRSPFYTACFTVYVGEARYQWKKSTGTGDKKLAQRIADELEDAGQGKRSTDDIKTFLAGIKTDLRAQRTARKAFEDVLRNVTGQGLGSRTTRGFIDEWLAANKGTLATSTFVKYERTAKTLYVFLGGKADQDMAALRIDDIAGFRTSESKRVSKSSANHALKIVRVFFAAAERDGVVPKNVARLVRPELDRQADKVRRRAFTLPELSRILAKCDDEWKTMVTFALYTGARLSDIASLTWQALDLVEGKINFVTGKTGRTVSLPIVKPLADCIAKLPVGDDPKQPLHPRAHNIAKLGRTGMLSNQFREILVDAGLAAPRSHKAAKGKKGPGRSGKRVLSDISFHALRHSAVSFMKNAGVPAAVVQDIVGHDSAAVNAHYTHIEDATKLAALDKLPVIGGEGADSDAGKK